ncbi:hypothetical protein EMIHUDRAFT_125595, partial [Emiliania huxleyi CCMP1516]
RASESVGVASARDKVTPSALNVKFKDSLSSNPEDVGQRGAFVGLGNTEPGTSADVFGLEQRGAVGDGDFRPSDGGGYVAYKKADYAHARSDTDVQMYLFETFGGWCNAVKRLFYQMKDKQGPAHVSRAAARGGGRDCDRAHRLAAASEDAAVA